MSWIAAAVVIVATVMVVLAKRSQKSGPASPAFPYQKAAGLFSPAERSFLGVLHQAVGGKAAIFGKVRVADVVKPLAGLNDSDRQKAFNRISNKHFDFLLCDKENLAVICAIELDDGSQASSSRVQRDEFLKNVCEAAGVPLVQGPVKSGYVIGNVRRIMAPRLGASRKPLQEPPPAHPASKLNGKLCPTCSAAMVKRVAKKGSHAGRAFWACSAFPKCKTVEAITG
jgi:hypothetical protein